MSAFELTGSSKASLAALRSAVDSTLKSTLASTGAAEAQALAADLATARAALDSSSGLRRALTDPARGSDAKSALVKDLFGKVISPSALSLVEQSASLRWSSGSDLTDAIEVMTIESLAIAAESAGESDALEGEILAIVRSISASSDLRQGLNDPKYSTSAKQELIASLFAGAISGSTVKVLEMMVASLRGRNVERTLAHYSHVILARKERSVAHVKSAVRLDGERLSRLGAALERALGRKIRVDVEVDPLVMGGISVRIGDELIDGTVVNRLMEASRSLAGRAVR